MKRFKDSFTFVRCMVYACISVFSFMVFGCSNSNPDMEYEKQVISLTLDSFNLAAANADYDSYFNYFTNDAIFIGTDATENWNKKSFMIWAKPYFDKKRAWNFKSFDRNIYFDATKQVAWFDELLDTQMKICRGSGVMVKRNNKWKIQQYVLSMTIPNELSDSVIAIKFAVEDSIIKNFKGNGN